jgi:hypothetical protein
MAQKFTNRFNNGDTIRGYDFQPMRGRGDSYIEGVVIDANDTSRGYLAYRIKVENRVFGGKQEAVEADEIGWIPHEVSFMEYDHRIIKV